MKKITLLITLLFVTLTSNAQLANGTIAPDFTATDINGNVHHLADYLAAGKTVIMDISATWCGPCWNYHNGKALDDVYEAFGPDASNEVVVIFVEGDNATTSADLNGLTTATQGDWVTGSHYPIIDSAAIANLYAITYFPTVYRICPSGIVTLIGQASAASIKSGINANCGVTLVGTQNNAKALENLTGFCSNNGSPVGKVKNYGTNPITAATLNLKENGVTVATKTSTGSFSQFATKSIVFDALDMNPASTYTIEIASVNSVPNLLPANNNADLDLYFAQDSNANMEVRISLDNYPTECSWRIKNSTGTVIATGGPYVAADANSTKIVNVTLTPSTSGCYTVEASDSYGDGWNTGATPHKIEIFNGNTSIYSLDLDGAFTTLTRANALKSVTLAVDSFTTSNYSIYPNPSKGILNFNVDKAVNVDVVDVTGKVVFSAKNVTKESNVDLSSLQKGVYLVKLTGDNFVTTEKLILN